MIDNERTLITYALSRMLIDTEALIESWTRGAADALSQLGPDDTDPDHVNKVVNEWRKRALRLRRLADTIDAAMLRIRAEDRYVTQYGLQLLGTRPEPGIRNVRPL